MKRTVIINCCIGLLFSTSVSAEIYRSQDRDGTVTFSDKPTVTSTRVSSQTQAYRYLHTVVKVYDGDTIVLKNGERVRLLGINTPEIKSRHRQGEKGGQTAKTWLETKLKQGQVYLEYDHTQRDKYKRLLAHCFLPDGEHLNETILEAGLASLTIIPPNVRYSDRLIAAQSLAEQNKRGIWGQTEYKPRLISALGKVDNHVSSYFLDIQLLL